MSFFAESADEVTLNSFWKYVEAANYWREEGTTDYEIRELGRGEKSVARHSIYDTNDGYPHHFRGSEIIKWFIPFDKNLRPGIVRLATLLSMLRSEEGSVEELHRKLVELEV